MKLARIASPTGPIQKTTSKWERFARGAAWIGYTYSINTTTREVAESRVLSMVKLMLGDRAEAIIGARVKSRRAATCLGRGERLRRLPARV